MSCNVKTKFVFLFEGMKVVMNGIYFKNQIMNTKNMSMIFLGFKHVILKSLI
jgi:hypothetical protein